MEEALHAVLVEESEKVHEAGDAKQDQPEKVMPYISIFIDA